jgi:hypothetical protein
MRPNDHQPRIRPVSIRPGNATAAGQDGQPNVTALYEVCCSACGDDEGPIEDQSDEVRRLRGPYSAIEKAREAVILHLALTSRDW